MNNLEKKITKFAHSVVAHFNEPNFPGCFGRVLVFPCDLLSKCGSAFELLATDDPNRPGNIRMAMLRKADNMLVAESRVAPEDIREDVEYLCACVMILQEYNNGEAAHKCDTTAFEGKPRYHVTPVTRIQFVDGSHHSDETEFDTHDEAELMGLFVHFAKENNISVYEVSGIERLYVWEPEDK